MKKYILLLLVGMILPMASGAQALHLFGGEDYTVYLGCLNCSERDQNSVWNTYSTYGSKYNSNSIWNSYGTYGGRYSQYSPWNPYASNPPRVMDRNGNFYGYLTVNTSRSNRATGGLFDVLYKFHEEIVDDVSKWHDYIFE